MRARRMRRRLFNVFAFACLAFALFLIAFSKGEQPGSQSAQKVTGAKTASTNNTR